MCWEKISFSLSVLMSLQYFFLIWPWTRVISSSFSPVSFEMISLMTFLEYFERNISRKNKIFSQNFQFLETQINVFCSFCAQFDVFLPISFYICYICYCPVKGMLKYPNNFWNNGEITKLNQIQNTIL